MTIDVRANIVCNLGHVLSGDLSDGLIGDGGLVKTSGTLVFDGTVMPAKGTRVELAYHQPQYGTITRFPRPLRVLRAVADPLKRTTTIDVGCKLTLMEEKIDPSDNYLVSINPAPWYQALSNEDKAKVAPTMTAQQILEHCLIKLGIGLAPGARNLEYQFLRSDFDFDNGYVAVINDLLKSERCYGFITPLEQLMVRSLNLQDIGSAPVMRQSDLIDLEPIAGGQEPAESVSVSFDARWRQ